MSQYRYLNDTYKYGDLDLDDVTLFEYVYNIDNLEGGNKINRSNLSSNTESYKENTPPQYEYESTIIYDYNNDNVKKSYSHSIICLILSMMMILICCFLLSRLFGCNGHEQRSNNTSNQFDYQPNYGSTSRFNGVQY
jgi:hypothetical protein